MFAMFSAILDWWSFFHRDLHKGTLARCINVESIDRSIGVNVFLTIVFLTYIFLSHVTDLVTSVIQQLQAQIKFTFFINNTLHQELSRD